MTNDSHFIRKPNDEEYRITSLVIGYFVIRHSENDPMILLIDNYDSFAHNLARYLQRLGQQVEVVRNDAINVAGVLRLAPQAIVFSPGPCTPDEAGCSLDVVRQLHTEIPMLGICLGHQTIAAALGAKIVRATTAMHGRTSVIEHRGTELFEGISSTFTVCRYHSLVVDLTRRVANNRHLF